MTTLSEIVAGAQFRADLKNTDRVSAGEWAALAMEAITNAWTLAASARPDFQVASQDFTVVSGVSASFATPANFYDLIDVVYAPDTLAEYSLGPFAWANRRSPGNWLPPFTGGGLGGSSARLMGNAVYIEPSIRAGGNYRLWYCPKPTTYTYKWDVRATTAGLLPSAIGVSGPGPGRTITAQANGVLPAIDGVTLLVGDRLLVNQLDVGGFMLTSDFGIYTVTSLGSVSTPWALTRAIDADQTAEVAVGYAATASEGQTNAGVYYAVTAFTTIDVTPMLWAIATVDSVLDPFVELLRVSTAIPAVLRDDDLDPRGLQARQVDLNDKLQEYFGKVRISSGPTRPIDTDAIGPRLWWAR